MGRTKSPLWVVPKKLDNLGKRKWRLVIDYRKLNEKTVSDKFPMPNIDHILDKLSKAQYFTTIDLAKGFHQVLVHKNDQAKTAFSTPYGHYEYVRMPFGLKNAPSTFQRLMNYVLRNYNNRICIVYMDDILIFSSSIEEHTKNIRTIFSVLRRANLKIQVDKCNFMKKETDYLGYVLTENGVQPNPDKIQKILNLTLPTRQDQIRQFLGISGYYRRFIKGYAKIAQPMTKFLKKDAKVNVLDNEYIKSFNCLKEHLSTQPILKYPNFDKEFTINTDASNYAIGAVLLQDGQPVSYISRTLNKHEMNYSTTEKEFLAVCWAVKYLRPYIYGRQFKLQTDHQAIAWLHKKYMGSDLNPKLQRWLLGLGEYNMKIDYIKGKENVIADFLSRVNSNEIMSTETVSPEREGESVDVPNTPDENITNQINLAPRVKQVDTIIIRFKVQITKKPTH